MNRFPGIDLLRVIACCMVLMVHACECYYISNYFAFGGFESFDAAVWQQSAVWAGIIGSVCRCSVPLFVIISGFLLLPMKPGMTMREFYRKRAARVIIPLAVWTVVYSVYCAVKFATPDATLADGLLAFVKGLGWFFVSFPEPIGHLWYVYMLIGLYLFIPVISPWVEKASKGEMRFVLGIWLFTMLVPLLHKVWPEILGECYWNPNSTVYYFSGFIGYLLAGAYARKFMFGEERSYLLPGILLAVGGYALTLGGFLWMMYNNLPTAENYWNYFPEFELPWEFCNVPVCMLTLGVFLLLFRWQPRKQLPLIVSNFSRLSYGVYLAHIMFLTAFYEHIFLHLDWPAPVEILCIGSLTIITTYLVIKALSFLPRSKYIVG